MILKDYRVFLLRVGDSDVQKEKQQVESVQDGDGCVRWKEDVRREQKMYIDIVGGEYEGVGLIVLIVDFSLVYIF